MILSWKKNNIDGNTWLVLPESQDSFPNWRYGTMRKIQMFVWLHLFYEKEQKEDQRAEFSVTFISFHFLAISIRGKQQDLLKSVKLSKPRIYRQCGKFLQLMFAFYL